MWFGGGGKALECQNTTEKIFSQGSMTTSEVREDAREDEGNEEEDEDDNSTICDEDNDSIGKSRL